MKKALFFPLRISLCTVGCLYVSSGITQAQVTSDGTVNTQVNQDGNSALITGGEARGGNLFHSFQDFSVGTGNEAFFNNANAIENIFSRVTGGNISNIDGLIRSNGNASLFLINPAGIIFGENARLDIGGSFYGSTASSILFPDGEFSAVDNLNQPTLTINAPIGLGFRDNPGDIVNRSIVRDSNEEVIGLEVDAGNTLALVGGNINFEAGEVTARSGQIFLGGLSEAGTVDINENGRLSFPEDLTLADINLSNAASVNVIGTGEGSIGIDARNLTLAAGEFGSSFIRGGVTTDAADSTSVETPGNITINVAENITLNDSGILNQVFSGGAGNAGGVKISTNNLSLTNGARVSANTFGSGNAGLVNVTATEDIIIDGEGDFSSRTIFTANFDLTGSAVNLTKDLTADSENSLDSSSGITSQVGRDAEGDAGGVIISTANLRLVNGGRIDANTFGSGNAGLVNVTATGDITIDGEGSQESISNIESFSSFGEGSAGGVNISTTNLRLVNGGRIDASTINSGNAGLVNVTATGDITIDGEGSQGSISNIESSTGLAGGDAGGITISTSNLSLTNGGRINTVTFGAAGNPGDAGDAGAIEVTATGDITVDGANSQGSSGITSGVNSITAGNAGGITISTSNLSLTNGGRINTVTAGGGTGNAGAIEVTTTGDITVDGESSQRSISRISSEVSPNAEVDAGGITISSSNLSLTNGAQVNSSTFGTGNAGVVEVTATEDIIVDGESSQSGSGIISVVGTDADGDSGGVTISTTNLSLTNGAQVNASTAGMGDAGAIDITATEDIIVDGESSQSGSGIISAVAFPDSEGDSGGITISSSNLSLTNGAQVNASTFGTGNAGAIDITATEDIIVDGESSQSGSGIISLVGTDADGDSGGVTISTTNLSLTNGAQVNASTFGMGDAGAVNIDASESIFISGIERARVGISANAVIENGDGGNINISTGDLTISNNGIIEASNRDFQLDIDSGTGLPGNIVIEADTIDLNNGAIGAATQSTEGVRGNIDLQVADLITLSNNSFISAQAFGNADGGNLTIDTNFIIAFPSNGTGNDIVANAERGTGGNINLNIEQLFGLSERPAIDRNNNNNFIQNNTNDIDVSGGIEGNLNINTTSVDPLRGTVDLPSDIVVPESTAQQACEANRESAAQNGLNISGKGGIVPDPALPLNSLNVTVNGENTTTSTIPSPIQTSKGKIQPARGIKLTESGEIILTAYRTNNAGDRIPEKRNCGRV